MKRLAALLLLAVLASTACDADNGSTKAATTTDLVTYHYGDSSVPPEHHRSFTVTADADEARIVVDSYGDVLHDVTAPMDAATWTNLVEAVAAREGEDVARPDEGGCTGGTTRQLIATDGDERSLAIEVAPCGGDEVAAEIAADVDAVIAPVLRLFEMDTLLASS